MSLTVTVVRMVQDRAAPTTVDDLMPELAEDGYTRDQVRKALLNAKFRGYLQNKRGRGIGRGSEPSTFTVKAGAAARVTGMAGPQIVPAVASVWQLGAANA